MDLDVVPLRLRAAAAPAMERRRRSFGEGGEEIFARGSEAEVGGDGGQAYQRIPRSSSGMTLLVGGVRSYLRKGKNEDEQGPVLPRAKSPEHDFSRIAPSHKYPLLRAPSIMRPVTYTIYLWPCTLILEALT